MRDESTASFEPTIKEKIMALMKHHNANAYYILRELDASGFDFLRLWRGREEAEIYFGLDSIVHLATIAYLKRNSRYNNQSGYFEYAYYMGNEELVYVPTKDVFPSEAMLAIIPNAIKQQTISRYIAKGSDQFTNTDGIYGLLREWMGFCYGMQAYDSLFEYFQGSHEFEQFVLNETIGKQGLAIKYFILCYLVYARRHRTSVYTQIMDNKAFCSVYKKLDQMYDETVELFDSKKRFFDNELKKYIERLERPYNLFLGEINMDLYQETHRMLYANG